MLRGAAVNFHMAAPRQGRSLHGEIPMIAIAEKRPQQEQEQQWQEHFLELMPAIQRHAELAFRNADPEQKAEQVQEVLANAWQAYRRLAERGKQDIAYASPLARYAIRQVQAGRKVGTKLNIRDPLSRYAQRSKGIHIERLSRYCSETNAWVEVMVEDHRTSVLDQVAFRIDVPRWLATLTERNRRIAKDLAIGFTTSEVAKKYRRSLARVSQIRRELERAWDAFHAPPSKDNAVTH